MLCVIFLLSLISRSFGYFVSTIFRPPSRSLLDSYDEWFTATQKGRGPSWMGKNLVPSIAKPKNRVKWIDGGASV